MAFPKFYLRNFVKNNFFSYFSQLLLTSSFFNKVYSCEIENSIYFDAMVYFLEYLFILQNIYQFFRIIFGHLFRVYFAEPVSILVFYRFLKNLKNVNT